MRKYFCFLIVSAAVLFACKPETVPDIGEPTNKLEQVEGNWQLEKVVQADLNAIKYGFPYKEVDVTSKAPFTDFKISFTLNDGAPAGFSTTPGNAPKIIRLATGTWKVDNRDAPKLISLINTPDTVFVNFGSYNTLSEGKLKLQVIKRIEGKDYLRYDYYFKKI